MIDKPTIDAALIEYLDKKWPGRVGDVSPSTDAAELAMNLMFQKGIQEVIGHLRALRASQLSPRPTI